MGVLLLDLVFIVNTITSLANPRIGEDGKTMRFLIESPGWFYFMIFFVDSRLFSNSWLFWINQFLFEVFLLLVLSIPLEDLFLVLDIGDHFNILMFLVSSDLYPVLLLFFFFAFRFPSLWNICICLSQICGYFHDSQIF